MSTIEQRVAALESHASRNAEERAGFSQVHAQYRELAERHGIAERAMVGAQPAPGETLDHYTGRLFTTFKGYSPQWKDVDLTKAGPATRVAARNIYEAAFAARPMTAPGELREIRTRDPLSGRETINWAGSDDACWRQFTNGVLRIGKFIKPTERPVSQPDFAPRLPR